MDLEQLKNHIVSLIHSNPDKEREMKEMLELCLTEIDAGESEAHEIELCLSAVDDILNEE